MMGCCGSGQDASDFEPSFAFDDRARSQVEELRGRLSEIIPPLDLSELGIATVNVPTAGARPAPLGGFERRQSMRLDSVTSHQLQQQHSQQPPGASGLQWTDSRKLLEAAIAIEQMEPPLQAIAEDPPPGQQQGWGWGWDGGQGGLADDERRLETRLWKLKLEHYVMEGDGACQFRAISFGLYGTQKHHGYVRRRAVEYIKACRQDFEAFLGEDFDTYVRQMARAGTWGDELTLRAACEALAVVLNIITSDAEHWFVRHIPRSTRPAHEIFITYIAPLHYNAVKRQNTGTRLRHSLGRQQSQLTRAVSTYQRRFGIPETPQHVMAASMAGG